MKNPAYAPAEADKTWGLFNCGGGPAGLVSGG